MAGLGTDKVAIAAHKDDAGSKDGGVVHVFSSDGESLATITNPPPRSLDYFGYGMTTVGTGKVAVGAICRVVGGYFATGEAYLFDVGPEAPLLSVECLVSGDMCVSWPASAANYVLESASALLPSATNIWSHVPYPYETNDTRISITSAPAGRKFYRLRRL